MVNVREPLISSNKERVLSEAKVLVKSGIENLLDKVKTDGKFANKCVFCILDGELVLKNEDAETVLKTAVKSHQHIADQLSAEISQGLVSIDVQKTAVSTWIHSAHIALNNCFDGKGSFHPEYFEVAKAGMAKWEKIAWEGIETGIGAFSEVGRHPAGGSVDYNNKLTQLLEVALSHETVARRTIIRHPNILENLLDGKSIRELISEKHGANFIKNVEDDKARWLSDDMTGLRRTG